MPEQNTEYSLACRQAGNQESGELRFMILDSITSFISKFIALVSKKSLFTKGVQPDCRRQEGLVE